MRKILSFLLAVSCVFLLTNCQKETDPGGTAVEKMAGDWWVEAVASVEGVTNPSADATIAEVEKWNWTAGSFGVSQFYTYNTAANLATEMFVDDNGNFWDYKGKVSVEYANHTFSVADCKNLKYDSQFSIIGGKILEGAAKTPTGNPADSIVFYIKFSDDTDYNYIKVSGFRRTGFPADDF